MFRCLTKIETESEVGTICFIAHVTPSPIFLIQRQICTYPKLILNPIVMLSFLDKFAISQIDHHIWNLTTDLQQLLIQSQNSEFFSGTMLLCGGAYEFVRLSHCTILTDRSQGVTHDACEHYLTEFTSEFWLWQAPKVFILRLNIT